MKTIISIIRIIFLYILIFLVLFAWGVIILYQFDTDGNLYQNIPEIREFWIFLFAFIFPAIIIFLVFKYKTKIVILNNFVNNNKVIISILLISFVAIITGDLFSTFVFSFIILIFTFKNAGTSSSSADFMDSGDSFSHSIDYGYSGDGGSFDGGGAGGSFDGGGDSGGSDGGGDGGD